MPLRIHETTEAWRGGRDSPEVPSAGGLWALGPQGGFAWVLPTLPTPPPQDSPWQSGASLLPRLGFDHLHFLSLSSPLRLLQFGSTLLRRGDQGPLHSLISGSEQRDTISAPPSPPPGFLHPQNLSGSAWPCATPTSQQALLDCPQAHCFSTAICLPCLTGQLSKAGP